MVTPAHVRWAVPRLTLLIAVLCTSVLVFANFASEDPIFRLELTRVLHRHQTDEDQRLAREQLAKLQERDPQLGAILPVPSAGTQSTARSRVPLLTAVQRRDAATLVMFVGSCSTCSLSEIENMDVLARDFPRLNVVVVSASSQADIAHFRNTYATAVPIIPDASQRFARMYNAAFTPRMYLVSGSHALAWCQHGDQPDYSDAVRAIKRLEQ